MKTLIEEGDFDKILTQPASPLFRISVMGMDLLDLLTLFPIVGVSIWAARHPVAAACPYGGHGSLVFSAHQCAADCVFIARDYRRALQ